MFSLVVYEHIESKKNIETVETDVEMTSVETLENSETTDVVTVNETSEEVNDERAFSDIVADCFLPFIIFMLTGSGVMMAYTGFKQTVDYVFKDERCRN